MICWGGRMRVRMGRVCLGSNYYRRCNWFFIYAWTICMCYGVTHYGAKVGNRRKYGNRNQENQWSWLLRSDRPINSIGARKSNQGAKIEEKYRCRHIQSILHIIYQAEIHHKKVRKTVGINPPRSHLFHDLCHCSLLSSVVCGAPFLQLIVHLALLPQSRNR